MNERSAFVTKTKIISAGIAALLLSGCGSEAVPAVTETSETAAETTTANPYLLVRGWDGHELLDSIFYCGQKRPLPLYPEDNPDFLFADGILTFPDGSSAEAVADIDGKITIMRFSRSSAPADFSVYGVGFDAKPGDIPGTVGIANIVEEYGERLSYRFLDGGITELTFVFEGNTLTEIYIAA